MPQCWSEDGCGGIPLEQAHFGTGVERRDGPYGSQTNLYKLDGLIAAAKPYAEEKLIEIAAKKKMRDERLARKKPKLTLVKSE